MKLVRTRIRRDSRRDGSGTVPRRRDRARLGPGRFRRQPDGAVAIAVRRHSHWPASQGGRPRRHAGRSARSRPARRRAVGPRALLRGARPAHGDVRDPRDRAARRQDAHPDQRRRRHQRRVHAGHADADRRPHQPDRQQSARRPERRSLRSAVSRHDRGVFEAAARAGATTRRGRRACRSAHGVYVARHGPSYETPAEIRVSAGDRRRRGRHVDRAGSDRRAPHGHRGARHLVHHQHGRRRAAAAARPRRGDGGGRRVRAQFAALLEGIIERL